MSLDDDVLQESWHSHVVVYREEAMIEQFLTAMPRSAVSCEMLQEGLRWYLGHTTP
jgi:hypothetical protein